MASPALSRPTAATEHDRGARRFLLLIAAPSVLAFAAGLLWATQGSEVFVTVLTAGLAMCF